jgi:hypothetical protein
MGNRRYRYGNQRKRLLRNYSIRHNKRYRYRDRNWYRDVPRQDRYRDWYGATTGMQV